MYIGKDYFLYKICDAMHKKLEFLIFLIIFVNRFLSKEGQRRLT